MYCSVLLAYSSVATVLRSPFEAMSTKSEELEKAPIYSDYDEEGPGMVFVLWPASRFHAALALPSVQCITPSVQQGKKSY